MQLSGARIIFDDQNVMLAGHGISAWPGAYTRSRLDSSEKTCKGAAPVVDRALGVSLGPEVATDRYVTSKTCWPATDEGEHWTPIDLKAAGL